MNKTIFHILSGIAVTGLFANCSGTRSLSPSDIVMPEQFSSTYDRSKDSVSIADMEWWAFYSDSLLSHYIRKTLSNNRDLQKARLKIEELKASYGLDKNNRLPDISGLIGGNNESNDYGGKGNVNDPEYDLKVTFNWEINLGGKENWAVKKGKANYEASVEEMRALELSLISSTAVSYFNLLALENEFSIIQATLHTREEALKQAKLRFEGGLTSETVYQQAMVEYSSTASLIPDMQRQLTLARNTMTLLMGEFPKEQILHSALYLNTEFPQHIPVGVPSELLERRPDIRAAAKKLEMAMANAGMVYANRFPSFRMTLTPGLENDNLTTFLKSPFSYIAATIAGPVFDFGRNKNKYRMAVAQYEQAKMEYENVVITAFTEVNNAINSYHHYHESKKLKDALREAADKYLKLAQLQYRGGTLNYIDVLDAQRRYFDAEIGVNTALKNEFLSLVNLYKALGGGF